MPPLLLKLVFDRLESAPMSFLLRPIARGISRRVKGGYIEPLIERHLQYMEAELGKHLWFAGEGFTAADIQMSFPLKAAISRGALDERRPRLFDFLERIHQRPAYRRAVERGGPYELPR